MSYLQLFELSGVGGSNTQVLFNDNGSVGGDSGFTYNKTTDTISLAGSYLPQVDAASSHLGSASLRFTNTYSINVLTTSIKNFSGTTYIDFLSGTIHLPTLTISKFTATDSGDNLVSFTALDAASNGGITYTPTTGNGGFVIAAPTGFAGPVINIKSNGSQTAYISDLGNSFFQQVVAAVGVSTDAIGVYGASTISLQNTVYPNSDNAIDLGTSTSRFRNIASVELDLKAAGANNILNIADSGGNVVGTWDYTGLASMLYFRMNNNIPSVGSVLTVDASGYGTWQAIPAPSTPALSSVLGAGNNAGGTGIDMNGNTISNPNIIQGASGSNYFLRAGASGGNVVIDGNSGGGSGSIVFGQSSSDTIYFVAGDLGGSPGNPATPVKYITVKDNGGGTFYMPLYQ